jgi:hypothetical protein
MKGLFMPREIITNDYKGEDRRNGGKLKISVGDYIKILTVTMSLIVGGTTGWVILKNQVNVNAEDIAEASIEIKSEKILNQKQNEDIIILQRDVQYIKDDVRDIKIMQKEENEKLNKILGKLEHL